MVSEAAARPAVKWLAQERALVRFKDDPALLHCRVILCCDGGNLVKVATPDRDINETRLETGPVYSEVGRLPAGFRKNQTYLLEHSAQGEFTPAELLTLTQKALEEGFSSRPGRRVTGKLVEGVRVPPRARASGVDEDTGSMWIVVYTSANKGVGDELTPPSGDHSHTVGGKDDALFSLGAMTTSADA